MSDTAEKLTVNLIEKAAAMRLRIAELEEVSETDAVNRAIIAYGTLIEKLLVDNAMLVLRYPDGRTEDLVLG